MTTRRLNTLLLALTLCLAASAQWKKVETYLNDGRPESALAEARRIQAKAKTPAERLQAMVFAGQIEDEISPDSIFATIRQVTMWHRQATRCDERAMTALVAAELLEQVQYRSQYRGNRPLAQRPDNMLEWSRNDYRAAIDEYRSTAWAQPMDSLHAIKAAEWAPLVVIEKETSQHVLKSQWWGNDLLHIVLADAPDSVWSKAKTYYATQGCSEPEIEDYIRRCNDGKLSQKLRIELCEQGIGRFAHEKRVAVLKNALMTLECPEMTMQGRSVFYPGNEYTFDITVKNVSAYDIQLYRMPAKMSGWDTKKWLATGTRTGQAIHHEVRLPGQCTVQQKITAPAEAGHYAMVITPKASKTVKSVQPMVMGMEVSRWQLMVHNRNADGSHRFMVVDAMSGKPAAGMKVTVTTGQDKRTVWSGTTDASGCTPTMPCPANANHDMMATIAGDDVNMVRVHHTSPFERRHHVRQEHSLYTDRAIYRPGHRVNAALIAFTTDGKEAQVTKGDSVTLMIMTPRHQTFDERGCRLDEMGTGSVWFDLPADAETGLWSIHSEHGSTAIRVEEYKRPTFYVELKQGEQPCADSLAVMLTARSYAGVPVRGAIVTGYDIDTLTTDAQGMACIKIKRPETLFRWSRASVNVDVTSPSGETQHGSIGIPLFADYRNIVVNLPSQIDRDRLPKMDVHLEDAQGKRVQGEVTAEYWTRGSAQRTRCSAEEFIKAVGQLPTNHYKVTFGHDTLTTRTFDCTVFSTHDTWTPDSTWFYVSADTLPCTVHIGSCMDEGTARLTVFDGTRCLTDTTLTLRAEAKTLPLPLARESDGLNVCVAMVAAEKTFATERSACNPQPDMRLVWQWDTFRDHTQPGGHEQWSGRLLRPDGTPASANVMISVYDASLDMIRPHGWNIYVGREQQMAHTYWNYASRTLPASPLRYAQFTLPYQQAPSLVEHYMSISPYGTRRYRHVLNAVDMGNGKLRSKEVYAMVAAKAPAAVAGMAVEAEEACDDSAEAVTSAGEEKEDETAAIQPRENFDELAVFAPCLRTDSDGRFTLDFTLPQSVTTWQLTGLAHTADMMTATTRMQTVAQKDVMVQLSTPRFMRVGDRGSVTATITNLTGEPLKDGMMTIEVKDAETGKTMARQQCAFTSDTVVTMAVEATTANSLTVTAKAKAGRHSDGEQRHLTIVDSRVWTTESIDLACHGTGTQRFKVPTLGKAEEEHAELRFTPSPVWNAIDALSPLMQPDAEDAISLANAVFACRTTLHLAKSYPQVQERRGFDLDSLQAAAGAWEQQLKKLQKNDGSFSWFPGGHGSTFITCEVAVELARLMQQTGYAPPSLRKAMTYLSGEVDKWIDEMKRYKGEKHLCELGFYYMYAAALGNYNAKQAGTLLAMLERDLTLYSMNHRAIAAVILHHNKRHAQARRFMTSLNEHIVTTTERGSYFDYASGSHTSIDRRLQTLTTAIEAKTLMNDTLRLAGLRRNLLQQRRTQGWENRLFGTAAVAAVLQGNVSYSNQYQINAGKLYTIDSDTVIALAATPRTIEVTGGNDGNEAWGALYIRRLQHTDSVTASSTGLQVRCETAATSRVGQRVTYRYTIVADRDYEWVHMRAPRAAGFEPTGQLSGYRYQGGLAYYQSRHDQYDDIYFESIPRGTYIIECDAYATFHGIYEAGVANIECMYATEFQGHSTGQKVEIKK